MTTTIEAGPETPQWYDLNSFLPDNCGSILDLGCGDGSTLTLCPKVPRRVGIDIDPDAIRKAIAKVPGAEFFVGTGESLPFPDSSFDAIVCCVAIPYMNIPSALKECARVVRPGGMILLSYHSWVFLRQCWRRNNANLAGYLFRTYVTLNGISFHLFGRIFRYPLRPSMTESFQTEMALKRCLREAGFEEFRKLPRHVPSCIATRQ